MSLRPLLVFVSLALIVDTSAYAAITPLLPGLSDEHDLSKAEAGILSAAYPAGTLLLSIPAAWLIMRAGAKRGLIAGLGGLALASLFFGLGESAAALVAARFIQGIAAAAMWAGAFAWLVALAPRERRAEAIGSAIGAAIAGALLGPVLGAVADEAGIRVVFGAFVLVPLAMIAWAGNRPAPPRTDAVLGLRAIRLAGAEPRMRTGMWLMAVPAIGFGLINVLAPLRLADLGAGAAVIAVAFLLAVGLEAVISPLVGRLADRRGREWPARIGTAGAAVVLALLPLPASAVLVAAGVMLAAPLLGMLWAPAMALITDGAEHHGLDPALGFGLANMAWGLGATVGASGGGALAEATADAVPYLLLAAVAVSTALSLHRQIGRAPAFQRP